MARRGSDDGNRLAAANRWARTHAEVLSHLEVLVLEREASGASCLSLTFSDLSSSKKGAVHVAARSTLGSHFPGGITQALSEVATVLRTRGQKVPRSLSVAESMQREYERGRSAESAHIYERIRLLGHEMGGDPIALLNDAIYLRVDPKYIFTIVERAIARPRRWDWYDAESDDSTRITDQASAALEATLGEMKRPRALIQSDERYADLLPILTALWDSSGRKQEKYRQVSAVNYRKALANVPLLLRSFDSVFDRYDALLTPAALGTAPEGLQTTGNPLMCTLWTYLGMPALN